MIKFVTCLCIAFALLWSAHSTAAATYTVTKTADTNDGTCDTDCSLREAVAAANGTADNDVVTFALPLFSAPQTITLSGTDIIMMNNGSLSIFGPGANRLTISGNNTSRIFTTSPSLVGTLSGVLLTAGNGVSTVQTGRAGAFYNNGGNYTLSNVVISGNTAANGGGLNNAVAGSVLTIMNSVVSGNTASGAGGGMQNFSTSTMNIINSTIAGNTCNSTLTGGGAIQANGTLNITNSTFSGNTAAGGDGGALYYNGVGLVMTNTTIVGNNATGGGSGGLHKSTTTLNANIRNTIIAGNTGAASPDATGVFSSQGNNIIQTAGTSSGWIASDQTGVDPKLAPFAFYGGLGMTYLPLAGSPAIDMGQNCVTDLSCSAANPSTAVTTDERGAIRPFGTSVDVGAVEASGNYIAVFRSAAAGVAYSFTVAPATNGFSFLLNSGSFGGITLSTSTSATLGGSAPVPGVFSGLVQIAGAPGQAFQNYKINVLQNPGLLSVRGRVLTSTGEPVGKAYVTLSGLNGQTYRGFTNPFGIFQIDDVPAGLNGTVVVNRKGIIVTPQQIALTDVIENLEIRALP